MFNEESATRYFTLTAARQEIFVLLTIQVAVEVRWDRAEHELIDAEMLLQLNRSEECRYYRKLSADIRRNYWRKQLGTAFKLKWGT